MNSSSFSYYQPKSTQFETSNSAWVKSFGCQHLSVLIICRGPIRKEAIDCFYGMGIQQVGILLSEKDSITYPKALSPELKLIPPNHVHRIEDYTAKDRQQRKKRIQEIIHIALEHQYQAIFAGYGFMAEDDELVTAIEQSGLLFIGPNSKTVRLAGSKDQAKKVALDNDVKVIGGINNITSLAVQRKYPSRESLCQLGETLKLNNPPEDHGAERESWIQQLMLTARHQEMPLLSTEDICQEIEQQSRSLLDAHPTRRIRLKAIHGGGGKGQRIMNTAFLKQPTASQKTSTLVREILNEVNANGDHDDKNILLEYNIESPRHIEIQVIGNGQWCISLGGRDCSVQRHEQKLIEISLTQETLEKEIIHATSLNADGSQTNNIRSLQQQINTLREMEEDATCFGAAVGLDSVSTFECIVDGHEHYFMEMNTRIQVEHRVSELCYTLQFSNPEDPKDCFEVESYIQLMTILACHKHRLPKPRRLPKAGSAIEVRLNAMNDALDPHPGGTLQCWSSPTKGEIRDDQGLSELNPDTQSFMEYYLAGAYDSNIALLLGQGERREQSLEHTLKILRRTRLDGIDLSTNLNFLYGLTTWLHYLQKEHHHSHALISTQFVDQYLSLVGELKQTFQDIRFDSLYQSLENQNENWIRQQNLSVAETGQAIRSNKEIYARKHTLFFNLINVLTSNPHWLAGWLQRHKPYILFSENHWSWQKNPLALIESSYEFLNMLPNSASGSTQPFPNIAQHYLWDHDRDILKEGLSFYKTLEDSLQIQSFQTLEKTLENPASPLSIWSQHKWQQIQQAHRGFSLGTEILANFFYIANSCGFYNTNIEPDGTVSLPEQHKSTSHQQAMLGVLNPLPKITGNTILAPSGGMFYPKQSPDSPVFVKPGDHVEKGDPLYIIEVMKMFNTQTAQYSGTVVECYLEDEEGVMIKKGQALFKIDPDHPIEENPEELKSAQQKRDQQHQQCLRWMIHV